MEQNSIQLHDAQSVKCLLNLQVSHLYFSAWTHRPPGNTMWNAYCEADMADSVSVKDGHAIQRDALQAFCQNFCKA